MDSTIQTSEPLLDFAQFAENKMLTDFFSKILVAFGNELNHIARHWYDYENGLEDIFALIERSYVGIFNNGIIRTYPQDAILQEYSVHFGGRNYGRCDYLVKHIADEGIINILFEAKQRQFDGRNYSKDQTLGFLRPFLEQGRKYFDQEARYYTTTTFVASLVFEWVRFPNHLEQVLSWSDNSLEGCDFYTFFHSDKAGLMVYGNLEKVL